MPLPEYTGTLGLKRAAHLLRRATFGATKQQIDSFASLTPATAITQLFRQTLPNPALPVDPDTNLEWVTAPPADNDGDLQEYFKGWFIGQMLSVGVTNTPLAYSAREKVVYFLHTHFTAIQSKIDNARALYYQNQLFRMFALDAIVADPDINFKELTKKVSVDNAMLILLDGRENVKGNPNENYARELLELYSIGRGLEVQNYFGEPPGNGDYIVYTEDDVKAAARVLSGWDTDDGFATLDPDTNLPRGVVRGNSLNASGHDNDPKTFSARLGGVTITPDPLLLNGSDPTEASALDEIDQLIEMIYAQRETSLNICRKIYRFFVYAPHTESDILAVDNDIIQNMADTLQANNYKIQPVIENLLRSQHFYEGAAGFDDDSFGSLIKSPLDVVTQTIKFFDIQIPDMTTSAAAFYDTTGKIIEYLGNMGLNFYEPYDVAGYEAYHQYPMYHRNWITVNYLTSRYKFIEDVFARENTDVLHVNVLDFVLATINNGVASDAKSLLMEFVNYLLPVPDALTFDTTDPAADDNSGLTAARMNYFLQSFLTDIDADPEGMWTQRWNTQTGTDTISDQLRFLFNALLQSPEYQLA